MEYKKNDKINNSRIQSSLKPTKTKSPTGQVGATSLPPTGDSFMYIETNSGNNGDNVFWSFKRTDLVQITNKTFVYDR